MVLISDSGCLDGEEKGTEPMGVDFPHVNATKTLVGFIFNLSEVGGYSIEINRRNRLQSLAQHREVRHDPWPKEAFGKVWDLSCLTTEAGASVLVNELIEYAAQHGVVLSRKK